MTTIQFAAFWIALTCLIGLLISWRFWVYYNGLYNIHAPQSLHEPQAKKALISLAIFAFGLSLSTGVLLYPRLTGRGLVTIQPSQETLPPGEQDGPILPEGESPSTPTSPSINTPVPTTTAALPLGRIIDTDGMGVNLRDGPSMTGTIVTVVAEGTLVSLVGEITENDGFTWQAIQLENGRQGWVVARYISRQ